MTLVTMENYANDTQLYVTLNALQKAIKSRIITIVKLKRLNVSNACIHLSLT